MPVNPGQISGLIMVIKSPFKDYYDFIANKYGGGDPKIVYPRIRIANKLVYLIGNKLHEIDRIYPHYAKDISEKYLIIAGKAYLIAKVSDLDDTDVNDYRLQPLKRPEEEKLPYWKRRNYGVEFGVEYPFLIELCRKVAPVFVISQIKYARHEKSEIHIYNQCPILSRIGLPAIISPEKMYQDISYFVGNLMHNPPDPDPPTRLSNTERIKKAGFDIVTSFRHRK